MNLQQRGDLKGGRLFSETIGCICHRENCVKEIFTWQCVLRKLFLHKTSKLEFWKERPDLRALTSETGKQTYMTIHCPPAVPTMYPISLKLHRRNWYWLQLGMNSFWGVFQLVPSNQLNKGKICLFLIYFYGIIVQLVKKQFLLSLIGIVLV